MVKNGDKLRFWQKQPRGYEISRYLRRQLQSLRHPGTGTREPG